jgi:arabinogalactan endo-1,4-beta-galactosidase
LRDWKEVLNKLDKHISNIIYTWRKELVLVEKATKFDESDEKKDGTSFASDVEDLKFLLRITSQILRNMINKDIYNSTEVQNSPLVCCLYFFIIIVEYTYELALY